MAGVPTADDKRIYIASRDNIVRALDRKSGNLKWKADLAARPAGGPLRLNDLLVMPLVVEPDRRFRSGVGQADRHGHRSRRDRRAAVRAARRSPDVAAADHGEP